MGNRRKGIGSNSDRTTRKRNRYATNVADRIARLSRSEEPGDLTRRRKAERLLSRSKAKAIG